jgi:hypothetical protein
MIRVGSNLIKQRITIIAVLCLAVSIFWPGWRADLRACNNGYSYPEIGSKISVEIDVDVCPTFLIDGLDTESHYTSVTLLGIDPALMSTIDTGGFFVDVIDIDGIPLVFRKPPVAWMLVEDMLTLYIKKEDDEPEPPSFIGATVILNGETLTGEMLTGEDVITEEEISACLEMLSGEETSED